MNILLPKKIGEALVATGAELPEISVAYQASTDEGKAILRSMDPHARVEWQHEFGRVAIEFQGLLYWAVEHRMVKWQYQSEWIQSYFIFQDAAQVLVIFAEAGTLYTFTSPMRVPEAVLQQMARVDAIAAAHGPVVPVVSPKMRDVLTKFGSAHLKVVGENLSLYDGVLVYSAVEDMVVSNSGEARQPIFCLLSGCCLAIFADKGKLYVVTALRR